MNSRVASSTSDSPKPNKKYSFRRLQDPSIKKYARTLSALIFNCIRFYVFKSWTSTFQYPPLATVQVTALHDLAQALQNAPTPGQEADVAFRHCVRLLFCHNRIDYQETQRSGRFFSPICSFIVLQCFSRSGKQKDAGLITQVIAHLMYCIRTSVFSSALQVADLDYSKSVARLLKKDLPYLKSEGEPTPGSFMINASNILTLIRNSHKSESPFTWANVDHTELLYDGHTITLPAIRDCINKHEVTYRDHLKQSLFFNQDIPPNFQWTKPLSDLVDNTASRQNLYSFVEDIRNLFAPHRRAYADWICKDPVLVADFVLTDGKSTIWRPDACKKWLEAYQHSCLLLATGLIMSTGPSNRASEVARFTLRESPGNPRNVGMVMKNVSLNATQDKTSHQHLQDHFVPHIPPRTWQRLLVEHLAFIRPFAELVIMQLSKVMARSEELLHAFKVFLWPKFTGKHFHMEGEHLSQALGDATSVVIGKPITCALWRSMSTVISRTYIVTEASLSLQETSLLQEYFDRANMHSSLTADLRYGGTTGFAAGAKTLNSSGFVIICYLWHGLMELDVDDPIISRKRSRSTVTASVTGKSPSLSRSLSLSSFGVTHCYPGSLDPLLSVLERLEERFAKLERKFDNTSVSVKVAVGESMAEAAGVYWPVPPPTCDPGNLMPVSEIDVHPSRVQALRDFLGNQAASFSHPLQGALLEHILRGRENILGVLATGFGKTMLIMMLSKMYARTKTIVVVLPLSSLHADFHSRAAQHGLVCAKFSSTDYFDTNPNVLTVAIEELANVKFFGYVLMWPSETVRLSFLVLKDSQICF